MIVHLDKMRPVDFLEFLRSWKSDKTKFHITEKVDGNYLAFGLDAGKFYLRSRSRTFYFSTEIPNIFFMEDFRRYYKILESIPWNTIFQTLSIQHGFDYSDTLEVEGEAIPTFDHNIIVYDKNKIGDGIFVTFNMKTTVGKSKNGRLKNPDIWDGLITEVNKFSKIKFFSAPTVDLSSLEFDESIFDSMEELIERHGDFLAKPARTPVAKEMKTQILSKISELGKMAKLQALKHSVRSQFGSEAEGLIISGPDGKLVKIVDTDKFTETKKMNWHFINKLISAERSFKKEIKKLPKAIEESLSIWRSAVETVQNEFDMDAALYITINKKYKDTQNGIDFALGMIEAMNLRLKFFGQRPEEIVDSFFNREILPHSTIATIPAIKTCLAV